MIYIIVSAILIFIFFLIPINISIDIHKIEESHRVLMLIKLLSLNIYKVEFDVLFDDSFYPRLKIRGNKKSRIGIFSKIFKKILNIEEIKMLIKNYKNFIEQYKNAYKFFLSKLKISINDIEIYFGVDNAYITGISIGIFYIILSFFVILIKNSNNNVEIKHIYISPHFCSKYFVVSLNCIFSIRLGYAIISGFKIIKTFLLLEVKKIGRTSNSIANENYYGKLKGNG